MAIYHLSVKTFKRASGQSATAAAAYRSGEKIRDERTGEIHDYRKKEGIESSEIVLPRNAPGWAKDREQLWNKAEESEKRKNAVVAREFEIALPSELTKEQRREVAVKFAQELIARHGFAADVSIHQPSREGDQRNHHAHILVTTRRLGREGFTEKTRELDEKINRGPKEFEHWRERFATMTNEALEKHQRQERVDHRTLKAQGIERAPTQHLGPRATAIERKSGQLSRITLEQDQQLQRLEQARLAREQEQRQREKEQQEKAAQEKAQREREQAAKAQELLDKRRLEQERELKKATPKAPEPTRMPPRAVAWRGPTSKPAPQKIPSPLESIAREDQEQLRKAQEERRAQEAEKERQQKAAQERAAAEQARKESEAREAQRQAEQRAAQEKAEQAKKESLRASMMARAAQLKQKEQEKTLTPPQEPPKPPSIDKEQLRQHMKEQGAKLRQEPQPTPQAQTQAKPKDKDRGPER